MRPLTLVDAQRPATRDAYPKVHTLFDVLMLSTTSDFAISVRLSKALTDAGRTHFWLFLSAPDDELLKIKNLGRKSLNELKEILRDFDLENGTPIADDLRHALESAMREKAARMPQQLPPDPLAHIDRGWYEQILALTARRVGIGTLPSSALPKKRSPKVQRALEDAQRMRALHPWAGVKS